MEPSGDFGQRYGPNRDSAWAAVPDHDIQSRYIEAAIGDLLIGCVYLPNGNPQPGPKFACKMDWFAGFIDHAATLLAAKHPIVLCGVFNGRPNRS